MTNNRDEIFRSVILYYFNRLDRARSLLNPMLKSGKFFGDGPQFAISNAQEELRSAQAALERMIELRKAA